MKLCNYVYHIANYAGFGLFGYSIVTDDKSLIPFIVAILMFGVGGLILTLGGFLYSFFFSMITNDRFEKYIDINSVTLIITNIIAIGVLINMTNIRGENFVMALLLANIATMCNLFRNYEE